DIDFDLLGAGGGLHAAGDAADAAREGFGYGYAQAQAAKLPQLEQWLGTGAAGSHGRAGRQVALGDDAGEGRGEVQVVGHLLGGIVVRAGGGYVEAVGNDLGAGLG
nr:hypothetical protein [Tanacetum cinerariifolium]